MAIIMLNMVNKVKVYCHVSSYVILKSIDKSGMSLAPATHAIAIIAGQQVL